MKDYIHRLDNFDGPAVGEIAVGYEMFDEAFEIYKKFGLKTQAIKVLLDNHEDLERALEYATKVRQAFWQWYAGLPCFGAAHYSAWQHGSQPRHSIAHCLGTTALQKCAIGSTVPLSQPEGCLGACAAVQAMHTRDARPLRDACDHAAAEETSCMTPLILCFQVDEPGVWTELGHAQLDGGAVNEAIASYLRSGDSSRYKDVIARSQEANAHGDLVKYLLMVRKKVKESKVRPAASPKAASFVSKKDDPALMAVLSHEQCQRGKQAPCS